MSNKVVGSGFLIAGTCIGAVTIVLPLSILPLGSLGVLLLLLATAFLLYYSGLLVFESAREFPKGTDLAEMAASLLGAWVGKFVQVLFCLLLYCLLAAYMTGGSALISKTGLLHKLGIIFFAFLGQIILIGGIKAQDIINRVLVATLLVCYLVFLIVSAPHVTIARMTSVPYKSIISSLPILATAFGYHVIIPSVRDYIGDDYFNHKKALAIGLLIPLVLYLIWCFFLYGLLPYSGEFGLQKLSGSNDSFLHITSYLHHLMPTRIISFSISTFMLTSILSSFIGIAISLFHSITGHVKKIKPWLCSIIVLMPPALFAILKPGGFLLALEYAAAIIAIISIIIPVLMVYKIRNNNKFRSNIGLLILLLYGLVIFSSAVSVK